MKIFLFIYSHDIYLFFGDSQNLKMVVAVANLQSIAQKTSYKLRKMFLISTR